MNFSGAYKKIVISVIYFMLEFVAMLIAAISRTVLTSPGFINFWRIKQ